MGKPSGRNEVRGCARHPVQAIALARMYEFSIGVERAFVLRFPLVAILDLEGIDRLPALLVCPLHDAVAVHFHPFERSENYANSAKDKMRDKDRAILNDNLGDGFYDFLLTALTPTIAHCRGGIYVAMSSSELDVLQAAFRAAGGKWSTFIIWAKNTFTLGRADYQRQYEPILYGWPEGAQRHWCGDRDQGDVWNIKKPQKNDLHPTMKPVELVERAIRNSSRPGNVVLDPFGGSGTTLIAAEKSGRLARLIELDPKYADVIVRRWQDWTGKQATREADGALGALQHPDDFGLLAVLAGARLRLLGGGVLGRVLGPGCLCGRHGCLYLGVCVLGCRRGTGTTHRVVAPLAGRDRDRRRHGRGYRPDARRRTYQGARHLDHRGTRLRPRRRHRGCSTQPDHGDHRDLRPT